MNKEKLVEKIQRLKAVLLESNKISKFEKNKIQKCIEKKERKLGRLI
jgi:hypothetical protein